MGNLADLGLADIFQIVSLSRRSGTLQLTTQLEQGEIVFVDGRVVAAYRSGSKTTVGDRLLASRVVPPAVYQEMLAEQVRGRGGEALLARFSLELKAWESALDPLLADTIYAMFEWDDGTFSFVLAEDPEPWANFSLDGPRAVVPTGVNPQYLAMEGARRRDERAEADSLSQFLARDAEPAKKPQSPERDEGPSSNDEAPGIALPSFPEGMVPIEVPSAESRAKAHAPRVSSDDENRASTSPDSSAPVSNLIPFPRRREDSVRPLGVSEESVLPLGDNTLPQPASPKEQGFSLVVVDDDASVLEFVEPVLDRRFRRVILCTTVASALRELDGCDEPSVLLCDVILPRSDGRGILGGLELVERLGETRPDLPVLLMTDYPNTTSEAATERLGALGLVRKPRHSRLTRSPEDDRASSATDRFTAELLERLEPFLDEESEDDPEVDETLDLGRELVEDIGDIVAQAEAELPPRADSPEELDVLRSMLAELVDPANRETITLLVLRYADRVVERAALFLVTRDAYVGLGGFSDQESSDSFVGRVRRTHVPTAAGAVFDRAVSYRALIRGPLEETPINRALLERLGGVPSGRDVVIAPLSSGGRVAAILYGDNPSGAPLAPTDGLEIFLQQAGLAMDRALLERRLAETRRKQDED